MKAYETGLQGDLEIGNFLPGIKPDSNELLTKPAARVIFISLSECPGLEAGTLRLEVQFQLRDNFGNITACISRKWAGREPGSKTESSKAWKPLKKRSKSHLSAARVVGQIVGAKTKLYQASRIFRMLRNRVRSLRLNRSIAREKACVPILSE